MNIGDSIKIYRKEKGLSQLDLCLKIGWENPSTLSRIEKGEVKPNRETLLKICEALEINSQNLKYLMQIMGYSVSEEKLTDDYINQMLEYFKTAFDGFPFPVLVESTFVNLFYSNLSSKKFFISENPNLDLSNFRLVDIINNSQFGIRKNILNWKEFAYAIAHNYISLQKSFGGSKEIIDAHSTWMKDKDFSEGWEIALKKENHTIYTVPLIYNHPKMGILNLDITLSFHPDDPRFLIVKMIPLKEFNLVK